MATSDDTCSIPQTILPNASSRGLWLRGRQKSDDDKLDADTETALRRDFLDNMLTFSLDEDAVTQVEQQRSGCFDIRHQ